jgi:RNAse (barnase) inhibitor barstar
MLNNNMSYQDLLNNTNDLNKVKEIWNLSKKINSPINLHINDEFAFRQSCYNGHIEVAKWLWDISSKEINSPINIHAKNEDAFLRSCYNGHIELAKWLWDISSKEINSPINIYAKNEDAFLWSCYNGHIELAKWLWDISKEINSSIDIHAQDEYAFRMGCYNGYIEVAKWLATLCEDYKIEVENNKIKSYKVVSIYNEIFETSGMNDLKKFFAKIKEKNKEMCIICKSEDENIMISLQCEITDKKYEHNYCLECFRGWYKINKKTCLCCFTDIEIKKAILVINS